MDTAEKFKAMADASANAIEDFNDFLEDRAIVWAATEIKRLIAEVESLNKENDRQSDALGQINAVCVETYPDCSGTPLAEMVRRLAGDLTLSRAEGDTFRKAVAHVEEDRLGSYTICGKWTLTAALTTEEIEMSHYRTALERGRAEGRREGMEEATKIAEAEPIPSFGSDLKWDGYEMAKEDIAAAIREAAQPKSVEVECICGHDGKLTSHDCPRHGTTTK